MKKNKKDNEKQENTQEKLTQNRYNSMDLDDDVIYNYLARGLRTPQNETERRWAKEGKKILESGNSYEISFN